MNNVTLMGRLTAAPELKYTPNNVAVIAFTVAVKRAYAKDQESDFIDIVAWRQTAEFVEKYFNKGDMIALKGAIQTRAYTDKNGNKRKAVEVVAENVYFCGSKNSGSGNQQAKPNNINVNFEELEDDEELPF